MHPVMNGIGGHIPGIVCSIGWNLWCTKAIGITTFVISGIMSFLFLSIYSTTVRIPE